VPANYSAITAQHIIDASSTMRAARRRSRPLKSEWLVEVHGMRYPANKLFQRAAGLAGLSLPPKSTHQVANFLISRGFTVLYNGVVVRSAADAMRIRAGGAMPNNPWSPPPPPPPPPRPTPPPPQPMKVAPPPPTRKATLELALVALEEALTAKAAERGITDEMRKSFDRYNALKANYLMRIAQGFKTTEEKNEAETVLRTALIAIVKIAV
jgi:hypothetical protein